MRRIVPRLLVALAISTAAPLARAQTTPADAQNAVNAATAGGSAVITKAIFKSVLTTVVNAISTTYTLLAPINSPTFTGVPAAPTAAPGTNTTQIATTAFAASVAASKASLASPTFTGTPAAPTAAPGTNTTQLATTAFVATAVAAVTPLDSPTFTGTPRAPTASVDTSTTQIATTAFVLGQAASATPLIDGTAAAGTSTRYARGDHIHPTDTSRAPLNSPGLTGTPTAPTAAVNTNTTQLATTAFVQLGHAPILRSQIAGSTIGAVNSFLSGGYTTWGDPGAGAPYVRAPDGTGPGALQDAAGTWWSHPKGTELDIGWFGAKYDNATDDKSALQAAVAANGGLGGGVVISGLARVGSTTITTNNTTIRCSGQNASGFYAAAANTTIFTIGTGVANFNNIYIKDCSFYEYSAGTKQSSGSYIIVKKNCFNCGITHSQFSNAYNAVSVYASNAVELSWLYSTGAAQDHYFIYNAGLVTGGDIHLDHVFSSAAGGTQALTGLHISGGSGVWVTNSDFTSSGTCTLIDPAAGDQVSFLFASNTAFGDGCSGSALKIAPTGGLVNQLTFDNSWGSTSLAGVEVECSGGSVPDGLYFINWRTLVSTQTGIALYCAAAIHTQFIGGSVIDASYGNSGVYSSIDTVANLSQFEIKDMKLTSGTSNAYTPTAKYAINIPAGTSNNYQISGNNFINGYSTAGINDLAGGSNRTVGPNLPSTWDRGISCTIVGATAHLTVVNGVVTLCN